MDDKDFDDFIDVPDTPDRLSARLRSHTSGRECISSRVRYLHNSGSMDRGCQDLLKDEVRVVDRTGPSRRPFIRPPKRSSKANGSVECTNTIIISPSDNPCTSQGNSRRMKTDQSSKHDHGCTSVLCSSSASADSAAGRRSIRNPVHEKTVPFRDSKQCGDKCRKAAGETNTDYSHHPSNSFQRLTTNSAKGKEKVDESISRGNESDMGHGKEIDLPSVSLNSNNERKFPKRFLDQHDVSSPRAVRQKRLVRNGFISPHNIATRDIQLPGENNNNLKNFGPLVLDEVSGTSQCRPEEKELTGDSNGGKDKGKGILHQCSSRGHGERAINTSSRNAVITGVDTARQADVNVEDFNASQSGWRSTRNKTNHLCINENSRYDVPENMKAVRVTSRLTPSASAAIRRQTRSGLSSRNDVDHDSVVILEDSPDLSSTRRPYRRSNPVIEVDEFSPEMRQLVSERAGPSVSNYLDEATARQMEADEILARELQEQLYNESLSSEFVAPILHEDQNLLAPTNAVGHRRTSVSRGTLATRARRQPQTELRQGLSPFRRRGRGHINTSMRSQQPRTRRQTSRRPSLLSVERLPHFPSNMDLDMRIDVLEAMESAFGDMDGFFETSSNIFQMQHDFNENDYEMLLALDENVHQAGASSRQINSLPESKVQSNTTCEETCAICLENPAIGETIRHLPCFHKFHKDCIDPWLSRSTSCPVCKSSIS